MLVLITLRLLGVPLKHRILYILNSIDPQASAQQLEKGIQAEGREKGTGTAGDNGASPFPKAKGQPPCEDWP